jgi:hypothetical protein
MEEGSEPRSDVSYLIVSVTEEMLTVSSLLLLKTKSC